MSTTPHRASTSGGRSAAEVNEEIRALWLRTGGTLSGEQRQEYQRLVLEWAAAYERASNTPVTQPPADSRKAA